LDAIIGDMNNRVDVEVEASGFGGEYGERVEGVSRYFY
jgi:hypothetical protein